jgi:hypothetical protein
LMIDDYSECIFRHTIGNVLNETVLFS